jgi:hypothetical protein
MRESEVVFVMAKNTYYIILFKKGKHLLDKNYVLEFNIIQNDVLELVS